MRLEVLQRQQTLPYPREFVFRFFQSPGNLSRITPEWLGFTILTPSPIVMRIGTMIDYTVRWLGIPIRWRTLITEYLPPQRFADKQLTGPYSFWHHIHEFRETEGGTEMIDTVSYALPFGILGRIAHWLVVRRQLEQIFGYRAEVISRILQEEHERSVDGSAAAEQGGGP